MFPDASSVHEIDGQATRQRQGLYTRIVSHAGEPGAKGIAAALKELAYFDDDPLIVRVTFLKNHVDVCDH